MKGLTDVSVPGFGHSDIRGFGLFLTDRSMVRRELWLSSRVDHSITVPTKFDRR